MNACECLLNLEEKFIDLMQKGVQQYSRPLRHCMMITSAEHHALFQNIEKILAISEYQLNQLISHDDSALFDMFNTIGKLYENKLRMSCEAFDIYLNGVQHSFDLLGKFERTGRHTQFANFVLESNDDINMDLNTFLLLPLYYVTSVFNSLQTIKSNTSSKNIDHTCLTSLLAGLEVHVKKSASILSRFNTTNPFGLLDMDASKAQLNLDEDEIEKVYTGELKVKVGTVWRTMKASLCRDRILFGAQEGLPMNQILLKNIIQFDFNVASKLEFQASYYGADRRDKYRLRLRADTLHEKLKWKCLLLSD